jgi:hypothetical protein
MLNMVPELGTLKFLWKKIFSLVEISLMQLALTLTCPVLVDLLEPVRNLVTIKFCLSLACLGPLVSSCLQLCPRSKFPVEDFK